MKHIAPVLIGFFAAASAHSVGIEMGLNWVLYCSPFWVVSAFAFK